MAAAPGSAEDSEQPGSAEDSEQPFTLGYQRSAEWAILVRPWVGGG
jgi:hypothetical protein